MSDLPNTSEPMLADDLVTAYLARRDVQCPRCAYNLRGVGEPLCPECGHKIELTIHRPGRSRGYLLFVLLALGWVLLAGTMNGFRAWERVQAEAAPARQTLFTTSSFSFSAGPGGVTRSFSNSSRAVVRMNSSGGVTVITTPSTTAAANAGPAWASVSQQTWINFGWWTGLGLLAVSTLILTLFLRRRFAADAPPWRIVAAAGVLFLLYGGYHALAFSREFFL